MSEERKKSGPAILIEVEGDDDEPRANPTPSKPAPESTVRSSLWSPASTLGEVLSLSAAEKISLELSAGPWVVMRRFDASAPREPVFFISAGWFETMQVGDMLSLLQTLRRDGELVCAFEDCTKTLFMERGDIVSAASTLPDDRLGQMLLARGRIDREVLAEADRAVAAGKRFGRFLLETGVFTQHDLYEAVQEQLERIILSLFNYQKGSFVFSAKPLATSVSRVKLPKQLMYYVLEGSRQSDELKEALDKVSDRASCLKTTSKPYTGEESESVGLERDVLAQIDGTSRTWQVLARSGWSETNTLMALARLLRAGIVEIASDSSKAAPLGGPARLTQPILTELDLSRQLEMVERFNLFLRDLRWAMVEGKCDVNALDGFFIDMTAELRGVFDGVEVAGDGSLDAKLITGNLSLLRLPANEARTRLRSALEDLTQFALWTAEDQLDPAASGKLKETAKVLLRGS